MKYRHHTRSVSAIALTDLLIVARVKQLSLLWAGSGDSGGIQSYRLSPDREVHLEEEILTVAEWVGYTGGLEINDGGSFSIEATRSKVSVRLEENRVIETPVDTPSFSLKDKSTGTREQRRLFRWLLASLRALKCESVLTEWNGSGDSGGIEYIDATMKDENETGREASELVRQFWEAPAIYENPQLRPRVYPDGEGGAWTALISVSEGTLTFDTAYQRSNEPESSDETFSPFSEIEIGRRCEICGEGIGPKEHQCAPKWHREAPLHFAEVAIRRIRSGWVPWRLGQGVTRWIRFDKAQDRVMHLRCKGKEKKAAGLTKLLAACSKIQQGMPPWAVPELSQHNRERCIAIARLSIWAYPYTGRLE